MAHIQLLHSSGPASHSNSRSAAPSAGATDKTGSETPFGTLLALGLGALDTEKADQAALPVDTTSDTEQNPELPARLISVDQSSDQSRQVTDEIDLIANDLPADGQSSESASDHAPFGIATPPVIDGEPEIMEETGTASRRPMTNFVAQTDLIEHGARRATEVPAPQIPNAIATDTPMPLQANNIGISQPQLTPGAPTTAPASASPVVIHEPVGTHNAWADSFSRNVLVAVGRNENLAEIRVTPPHLGPIEVSISMSGDDAKVATVHFSAHHVTAREAIEHAMPRLREMFAEAGIALGNATVDSGSPEHRTGEERPGRNASGNPTRDTADSEEQPKNDVRLRVITGKVDTFA